MSMFCFQCEETAKGTGCTVNGVCGKKASTANLQDELTGELVGLAKAFASAPQDSPQDAAQGTLRCTTQCETASRLVVESLVMTGTNVNFDDEVILRQIDEVAEKRARLAEASTSMVYDLIELWDGDEDMRSLKSLLLLGLRGMAAYAHHAFALGKSDQTVNNFFYKGLAALGEDKSADEMLALLMELGEANLSCMALLDDANTGAYGDPVPTQVSCNIESGPFIVISGHDLHDLKLLLEQTKDSGINIYTHCEMLPAHAYPELKKYPHLKGNFGTAWQNQQSEFADMPAAVLFTSNCIMPVKANYADRVFSTSAVAYPGVVHIGEDKDFTPLISKALALGGYADTHRMCGINGGDTLSTGFGRATVLSAAGTVIDAVKAGAIRHFFLVGGCDGAKPGRNYYSEFVKQTPADTVVLTLACGKFRFNDLNLGEIGGLPRLLDMGQCNDAYGAIKVALALSEAFECSVNELPLTLVLSWYEQKAVCILLTLLSLGIKNIYLGPTLPAFVSPNILSVLVDMFNLTPISTPEEDLKKILG